MSQSPADLDKVVARMRNWSQRARPTDRAFVQTVPFMIGNGISVLTIGLAAFLPVEYNARLVGIKIQELDGIVGNAAFDIQSCSPGSSPDLTTITGSGTVPQIVNDRFYKDYELTGWNTTITDGDYIAVYITSNDVFTRLSIALRIRRKD